MFSVALLLISKVNKSLIQNEDVTEPQHVIMIPLDVRYLSMSVQLC